MLDNVRRSSATAIEVPTRMTLASGPLEVTARGCQITALGGDAYDQIRLRLEASEGPQRLETVERVLRSITCRAAAER